MTLSDHRSSGPDALPLSACAHRLLCGSSCACMRVHR